MRIAAGDDGQGGGPGRFAGQLANEGEQLTLVDAQERIIQQFRYGASTPWPAAARGSGSSLEIVDPMGNYDHPGNWQSSRQFGGTPGTPPPPSDVDVVINEVLAYPRDGQPSWIELYNAGPTAVEISRWYLSNDGNDYFQSQISGSALIPPQGYYTVSASELGLDLDGAGGDELWLTQADPFGRPVRFVAHAQLGPSRPGVSLGPGPTHDARWIALAQPTPGGPNSGPAIGDLVFSELHYHPADPDGDGNLNEDDFEFIELYNHTDQPVDLSHWQLAGTVQFTFPPGTAVPAGQSLVVVGFDPNRTGESSIFRFLLSADPNVPLLGPYTPSLDDQAGQIELLRPGLPAPGDPRTAPMIPVDQLRYQAQVPWPPSAAGAGHSLARTGPADSGVLVTSWTASEPSPGFVQMVRHRPGDADRDGDFDRNDVVLVLQGGKYLTGQLATWSEGDWTGDGLFDQSDLVAALRTGY
jgi:hypothetical protein